MIGHKEPWNYGLSFYFRAIEEANEWLKPKEEKV
jgi:hypothetical protein